MQIELGPTIITPGIGQTYSPDGNGGGYFESIPRLPAGLPGALRDVIRQADELYISAKNKSEEHYRGAAEQLDSTLDKEVEARRVIVESEGGGALDPVGVKLEALASLIREKLQQFNDQTVVALSYHGTDPLVNGFTIPDGVDVFGYLEAVEKWNVAFAAGIEAKLLNEQISALNSRLAEQQAQESARQAAEQQALESARRGAELELQRANTYSHGVSTAGMLTVAQVGGGQFGLPQASAALLRAAISTAIIGIAGGGGAALGVLSSPVVLAGLVVGVVALLVPGPLGDSQRPLSLGVPLSDLLTVDGLDLQAIAAAGGVVELPYTLVTDKVGSKTRISVVKPDGILVPSTAKVISAQFDAASNVYTVTLDTPARTFVFTPVDAPGSDALVPNPKPAVPVEGPSFEGVKLDPLIIEAERLPVHDLEGLESIVLTFPIDSGLAPLLLVFSSPYGETDTVGVHSGREYHSAKAGGPIVSLDWQGVAINAEGIELVKLHTARFGVSADNSVMIARLEMILAGTLDITDTDKRFYTHEIRELERYRVQGVTDAEMPGADSGIWNSAHAATLEDYKLGDVATLFYTNEAIDAQREQLIKEFGL